MARKTIIAGNWKMNLLPIPAEELVLEIKEDLTNQRNLEVVVIPQAALIPLVKEWTIDSAIQVGAQNCSNELSGAYTGEVSAELLRVLGCGYCLVGHSERREMFSESNEFVGQKAQTLISMNITPIVCVGETLEERESNAHFDKILAQVKAVYDQVDSDAWAGMVFAYEPIWAIGTGKTASKEQANEIHQFIRKEIRQIAGEILAGSTSILYGGSAKPSNAAELLDQSDIDGLLVGGAALDAGSFSQIINAYKG
jgi:triosephosphate isomerase